MKILALERVYHVEHPAKKLDAAHEERKRAPENMSDASILCRVCRVTSNGDGQIICSDNCVCYNACQIGHEYMRRPHLWGTV